MARPRKPRKASPTWDKRNEKARRLGYRNYYHYRTSDYGKRPPTAPRPTGARLRRLRGHIGRADFLASLGEGDLIIMPAGLSSIEFDPDLRDGQGAYREIVKLVIDGDTGQDRTYVLRNLTRDELVDTIEAEEAAGAIFSPAPSLDQRRLVNY